MCEDPDHKPCKGKTSWVILFLWVGSVVLLLCCFGCSKGSNSQPVRDVPIPAVEEGMEEAFSSQAFERGEWPEVDWWTQFNDPQLGKLIEQGLSLNPSISLAEAQARLAKAQADAIRSPLFPALDLDGDITKYNVSQTGVFGYPPPGSFPFHYNQSEVYLNFQWEIDWWGKNRQALMAALGEVQARVAEAAASRVALGIQIAEAYFNYQAAQARLVLAEKLVANREENLRLIKQRGKHNLSSDLDINSAERDLSSSRAFKSSLEQAFNLSLHQVKALVAGEFDETVLPVDIALLEKRSFQLPSNLPLDLLSHRPNIAAQIWRTDAAARQIGVAKAQFLPNFNLLALGGFQTITFSKWFHTNSRYGDIGPAIHLPIFEGGALLANLSAKEEEYTIAVLEYESLLLKVVQEVLDGISNVKSWDEQAFELAKAAASSKQSYELSRNRMTHHVSSLPDVLQAEKQWLNDRDAAVQASASSLIARLGLIQALGGGYMSP